MDVGKKTAFLIVASAIIFLACPIGVRAAGCCCPSMWTSFGQHCYRYFSFTMTWNDAEMFCRNFSVPSLGNDETVIDTLGHLVSIHSLAEQNFVATLYESSRYEPDVDHMWIGLEDISTEGSFKWTDGTSVNFTNWSPGNPDNHAGSESNENCGELWTAYGNLWNWNDLSCSSLTVYSFMCKLPVW